MDPEDMETGDEEGENRHREEGNYQQEIETGNQTQENESQAEENEPQVQENEPQTQENEPQAEENEPQVQENEPQVQENEPQVEEIEPQVQENDPQVEENEPQVQENEPQVQENEPAGNEDSQEETVPTEEEPQKFLTFCSIEKCGNRNSNISITTITPDTAAQKHQWQQAVENYQGSTPENLEICYAHFQDDDFIRSYVLKKTSIVDGTMTKSWQFTSRKKEGIIPRFLGNPEDICNNYFICAYEPTSKCLAEIFDDYIVILKNIHTLMDTILITYQLFNYYNSLHIESVLDKDYCLLLVNKFGELIEACDNKDRSSMIDTYNFTTMGSAKNVAESSVVFIENVYKEYGLLTCDGEHISHLDKQCSERFTCPIQSFSEKLYWNVHDVVCYANGKNKHLKIPIETLRSLIASSSYKECPICYNVDISSNSNLGKPDNCSHLFCYQCIFSVVKDEGNTPCPMCRIECETFSIHLGHDEIHEPKDVDLAMLSFKYGVHRHD